MTQSDAYFRALLAYRKSVGEKRECARDSQAFAADHSQEYAKVTRVLCTVDEEWIKEIEKGLVFIEKAIKEDRQFIYSNGEVVDIEKVKHVSKDSVEHLARHANLITRLPEEGKNLTPDKLYTVERISDYTVYENRFLYMLLCYLRDFVTLRYRQILDLTNRYDGRMELEKEVAVFNRKVKMQLRLQDERRDDPYLRANNPNRDLIDRMDLILKTILAFLATPLMESVSKVAMLKPPITKTNVLKMDNNFKGAVALYEYIIAYEGPGYTTEPAVREMAPFKDDMAEDLAEAELLIAFILYEHGLGMTPELKLAMEADETFARQEELRLKTKQLEQIRRRLEREGEPAESYILTLEKHVRALQHEADKLTAVYKELDELRTEALALRKDKAALAAAAEAAQEALAQKIAEHEEQMREAAIAFQREKAALVEAHIQATLAMEKAHEEELEAQSKAHREAIAAEAQAHTEEVSRMQTEHREIVAAMTEQWNQTEATLTGQLLDCQSQLQESLAQQEKLTQEVELLRARLRVQQIEKGQISEEEKENMTSEEGFDVLEREYEAFRRFYKEQWGRTKRKIRLDFLNMKFIKGQSDED